MLWFHLVHRRILRHRPARTERGGQVWRIRKTGLCPPLLRWILEMGFYLTRHRLQSQRFPPREANILNYLSLQRFNSLRFGSSHYFNESPSQALFVWSKWSELLCVAWSSLTIWSPKALEKSCGWFLWTWTLLECVDISPPGKNCCTIKWRLCSIGTELYVCLQSFHFFVNMTLSKWHQNERCECYDSSTSSGRNESLSMVVQNCTIWTPNCITNLKQILAANLRTVRNKTNPDQCFLYPYSMLLLLHILLSTCTKVTHSYGYVPFMVKWNRVKK